MPKYSVGFYVAAQIEIELDERLLPRDECEPLHWQLEEFLERNPDIPRKGMEDVPGYKVVKILPGDAPVLQRAILQVEEEK